MSPSSVLSLPALPFPVTFPSVLVGVPPFCSGLWGGGSEDVGYE